MKGPKERAALSYENKSAQFLIKDSDADGFQKQFYFIYRARIDAMTPRIISNAKRVLGADIKISQLADVTKEGDFFVIGVILKKMKYRRSILTGFTDEETMDYEFREKLRSDVLASDDDNLELEDHQQIIKLGGNILPNEFVSGVVIGILGFQEKDDLFSVKQVVLPELANQIPWPLVESDCYVLFVSGLSLSDRMEQNESVLFALDKLSKWLSGEVPMSEKELVVISNISRVIIAGDSVRISDEDIEHQKVDFLGSVQELDKDAIAQFDKVLSRFVSSVPVDVMSGLDDPTSTFMPQQPISRIVFPVARRFGRMLGTVTNPYKFELGGVEFLGTSGQNIRDLNRLTSGSNILDLMGQCLERGHTFPTVPDSIDGFPLQDRDPLIIDDLPHVFFAGNQPRLQSRIATYSKDAKTLLLAIPAFRYSKCAVLLNLRNLKLKEYDFSQENDLLF